jgi:hypothetical protein
MKTPKQMEHPIERQVAPLPHEVHEREGNGEIGDGDEEIGDEMEAHQARIPEVTMPVRHETAGAEKIREEVHAHSAREDGRAANLFPA